MTKTLYGFEASIWSAVTELAVAELGYKDGDVTFKVVKVVEGENFAPCLCESRVEQNPAATIPVLESDGKVYTSTASVVACLVKDAPVKVKAGTAAIIETIHQQQYDPNFALFLTRDEAEMTAKRTALPGTFQALPMTFLANRQQLLEKYTHEPDSDMAPYKALYEAKLAENTGMRAVFTGTATASEQAAYFAASQAHFETVKKAVFEVFPAFLPEGGFIGGSVPGEDDFHAGAWFTRIAAIFGATTADEGVTALEKAYGAPVPVKVAAYWEAWTGRASWKKVYAKWLH
ncbi:GST N-terminal domain-containing protein [Mycena sanguinolenta]|uniref:GST N-terminal domain-containing protein n=1 Tax=Mycena sanguinolenta TaxID=230812 RepID=A0A8H6XS76_9AGAR|nr:GST N-terminal domain-containing protein [Mycena sanguinolenta]